MSGKICGKCLSFGDCCWDGWDIEEDSPACSGYTPHNVLIFDAEYGDLSDVTKKIIDNQIKKLMEL